MPEVFGIRTWGMARRRARLVLAGLVVLPHLLDGPHPVTARWSAARLCWVCSACNRRVSFGGAVRHRRPGWRCG